MAIATIDVPPEPTEPAPDTPEVAEAFVSSRLREAWLEPLQERSLQPLAKSFSEACQLSPVETTKESAGEPRVGRAQLLGWLYGHVLSLPYARVQARYLGPSARAGLDVAEVDLLDACGQRLARVTAKLRRGPDGYEAAEVRVERTMPTKGCEP